MGVEYVDSVFAFLRPAIGHIFLYLFVEGIVFLTLAMVIEVSVTCVRTLLNVLSSDVWFCFKVSDEVFFIFHQRIFCRRPNQVTGPMDDADVGVEGLVSSAH